MKKMEKRNYTQEEQTELRQLLDQGHGPGRAEEQQTLRLADFLRHDELYQNYPQLRQAALRFADLPEGTHGSYNTGTNTITLNNSLRDAPEDTLVHEIQHAIQSAEGFSGGSSPEYWARREYETGDLVSNRLQQEYDQILNGLGREDQSTSDIRNWSGNWSAFSCLIQIRKRGGGMTGWRPSRTPSMKSSIRTRGSGSCWT